MVRVQFRETLSDSQGSVGLAELRSVLESVDASALFDRLAQYRQVGRKGYPLAALWRAYLSSFILGLASTNELIRRLQDDPEIRLLCGFSTLPHRTTFNRFINRLALHRDLVEDCLATLTDQLAELLPGLGQKIAVDSSVVKSHSSPNRKPVSDPEASWTAKNSTRSKSGKEWHWGYKYHLVADATYGVPLYGYTTTASRNDSPELPKLLSQAEVAHPWLRPTHVMADKGYDSRANHEAVAGLDAILVCPARRYVGRTLYEGIYTSRSAIVAAPAWASSKVSLSSRARRTFSPSSNIV